MASTVRSIFSSFSLPASAAVSNRLCCSKVSAASVRWMAVTLRSRMGLGYFHAASIS